MKKFKLEDIDRKRVLVDPPEGYFDRLPGVIQAKTAHKSSRSAGKSVWIWTLRLVPAAAVLILIALYSGVLSFQTAEPDFEQMLAEVSAEEIIRYLEESDLSSEEILQEVDLNALSMEFEESDDVLMEALDIEDETLLELYEDFQIQDSVL